jgi:hypothetical protein
VTGLTAAVCNGLAVPLDVIIIALTVRRSGTPYIWPLLAVANGLCLVPEVLLALWPWAAFSGACCLYALWMWWRNRRNKGRLRAALSGKYRHVRDAMVRTLRERRAPRPVLAPGGVS